MNLPFEQAAMWSMPAFLFGIALVRHVRERLWSPRRLALPAPTEPNDEADMPSARVNKMIAAGRRHLQANPAMLPNDRSVAIRMKHAVPDFTAAEHAVAIDELGIEFARRARAAAKA